MTVKNEYGVAINFHVAINLMNEELLEQIHSELEFDTEQEFFDEYAKRHEETFGEEWELSKENPVF